MNKRVLIKLVIIALAIAAVIALTPLRGMWRSTAHFLVYPSDHRVRFETGTEKLADAVASALPNAIATVERQQYRSFVKPVTVYICASPDSLASYGGPKSAGGFVLNGRLFLSSKPENTPERIPRLLTHELSHLHLEQQLGLFRYALNLPTWFKEGLAVVVSNGGGAETVSEAEARAAIASGHTFDPPLSGRLLFQQSGRTYGLSAHMWYRQSALLVQFLRDQDEAKFRSLLLSIQDGHQFERALAEAYSEPFNDLLKEYRSKPN